jgi:two-component system phosphate regulon sensor histidine kinase PhoR
MWRSPFLWQLFLGFFAVILVTAAVVGYLFSLEVEDITLELEEVQDNLRRDASLLEEVAKFHFLGTDSGKGQESFQDWVRRRGRELGVRVTVVDSSGVVAADSEIDPETAVNLGDRPEIVEARNAGEGTSTRFSDSLGERLMYRAVAVRDDGRLLGFVRTAVPLRAFSERLGRLRWYVFFGAAVAAAAALAASLFLAKRVTRPLTSLTSAAEAIARGSYGARAEVPARGEIGDLARSFNAMAAELSDRIETLSRSENKVRTILSGMVEGVVAADRAGRLLHVNDAGRRMLGVYQAPPEGMALSEVTRVDMVSELLDDTLRDGCERREEIRVPASVSASASGSGGDRVIEAHASPLRDGAGEIAGAVVILHDVTDLRRLETVRRDFVANVSHELKTPVTAIRGLVETLLAGGEIDPATRTRFLEKLGSQAARLSALVGDLLTLSRIESPKESPLERKKIDVRERVVEAMLRAHPLAEEKGLRLESSVSREPMVVLGDEEVLQTVIDNLLDNAIKYTPRGGAVYLRVEPRGDAVVLEVEDTGIGIAREHHERIFERFYRVDRARSRELGGTGLGLSIVRHAVGAMGGSVRVESELGKGSTFRVELPRAREG